MGCKNRVIFLIIKIIYAFFYQNISYFCKRRPAGIEIDIYNARGQGWPYYDILSVFHFYSISYGKR